MYEPIKDQFKVANDTSEFLNYIKNGLHPVPEPLQPLVLDHIKKGGTPKTMTDETFKKWRKAKRAKAKMNKKRKR